MCSSSRRRAPTASRCGRTGSGSRGAVRHDHRWEGSQVGERRLADLSPKDVYAWRLTIPEGHRFEATQALRQVLNRAVDWGLLDSNPAKCGIRNTPRRAREKRPFETWQQVEAVAAR